MKKLMIAAAIVCAAAMSQASQVSWGLSSGDTLDATKVDAGKMYMCYTANEAAIDWSKVSSMTTITEASLATIGFEKIIAQFDYDSSSKVSTTTSLTPSGTGMGTTAHNYYYVCIDAGGEALAYAGPKSMTFVATPMGLAGTLAGSSFDYATVPEPTSGLLLLLGVAGLALKRRRA